MSSIKADAVEAATGINTDLVLTGKGTGVPDIETGFKVSGTVGLPVSNLRTGTDGELITWDASGNPTTVAVGTAAQVLTSNGAGAAPTFQDAAAGGKVLQVIQSVNAGQASTSSTSLTGSGISASITPSATSSKVLAMVQFTWSNSGSNTGRFSLLRGATNLTPAGSVGLSSQANRVDSSWSTTVAYSYLDSPSTTSSTTYEISFMATSGTTYIGDNSGSTHDGCIIITLMEIGA